MDFEDVIIMCMSGNMFFGREAFLPGFFGGKNMPRVLPPHIMSEHDPIFVPGEKSTRAVDLRNKTISYSTGVYMLRVFCFKKQT